MAETQFVVFKLGEEEYAVTINEVREIIHFQSMTKLPDAPAYIEGMINLRGKIIPVLNLAVRFGQDINPGNTPQVIIIETGSQDIGVIVNEVKEVIRIPDEQIERLRLTGCQDYVKGVGKINERLLVIVELKNLLTQQELEELQTVT